ncbi:MAG: Uma2 family endonuclease [Pirellulales bacterium]|nr:Uma2 family endonuclease [Pirellulales bacterium]
MPEDGQRYELVLGALQVMSPAGLEHGWVAAKLWSYLTRYLMDRDLGTAFSTETGFVLSRNPDTVRAPDIAFVRANRLVQTGIIQKYFPGAPDLAIEIISPEDRYSEVDAKVQEYLSAGSELVWIVNPRTRTVSAYGTNRTVTIYSDRDDLTAPELLPGFSCRVADLFPKQPA